MYTYVCVECYALKMGCCHSADENGQAEVIQLADHKAIAFQIKGMQPLTFDDVKTDIDKTVRYLKKCESYSTDDCTAALEKMVQYASSQSSIRKESAPYLSKVGYGQLYVKMTESLYDYRRGLKRDSTGVLNLHLIQMAFWNFTDVSAELGRDLGQYGGVGMLFEDLAVFGKFKCDAQIMQYVEILLGVLHNAIYMYRDNRQMYCAADVVSILTEFLNSENMTVKMKALLILSYCVDEKESSVLATAHGCVSFMTFMLSKAVDAVDHRVISENSAFSAKEILSGLNQLAVNDDNKCEIEKENGVSILVRMLQPEFTEEEQILAAEGLWNLSFMEEIRTHVLRTQCTSVLDVLTKSENPGLRQASKYALWELKDSNRHLLLESTIQLDGCCVNDSAISTVGFPDESSRRQHVMISYQWDSQQLAMRLKENLVAAGFNVWMDVDQIKGDLLNAMAKAVEHATAVIVFMTEKYKASLNCRSEASYAYKQEKLIVPVLAESGYKPDGWLGILLGMRLYYEVFTESLLSKNITGIIDSVRELNAKDTTDSKSATLFDMFEQQASAINTQALRSAPASSNDLLPPRSTKDPSNDVRAWSKDRVQKWFEEKDMPELCSVLDFCDGKHLLTLHTRHSTSPEALQMDLKDDLCLAFHTRLKFATALDELFNQK